MDQQTLLIIMTVFVIVAAIALSIQAALLFGIYKRAQDLQSTVQRLAPKVEALVPKVESLIESSRIAVDDGRKLIVEVTSKTSEILDSARRQMARIDDVLADAAARALVQFDRAEMVLDDAMIRAQETVALVHGTVMKPLREIQGVATGLRTAISFFVRGGKRDPARATADEEMFI